MRALLASLMCSVSLLCAVGMTYAYGVNVAYAAPVCHEDDPCWAWVTMGNHRRGVTLTSGERRIVSPCSFARLVRSHRIDWARTPRLRGDWTARIMCGSQPSHTHGG